MIDLIGAIFGFFIMLGLMFVGLHVGIAMLVTGVLGAMIYFGPPVLLSYGTSLWAVMNDFLLTTIPLFVLLGEILLRAGITRNMYESLTDWLSRMPGGLLHTNIGACALFSAVSGSSVATAATIGTVALDEFKRRVYNEPLVLGSIAAGATLGSYASFSQPYYLWCINEYIDRPIVRSGDFARDPAYHCFHDYYRNCGSLEAIAGRTSY